MSELADFLSAHAPQAHHDAHWGEQDELWLQVTTYLCDRLPPRELVTSARAVVLRDGGVLVVRDPDSRHILPGGRCEPGETLEQTVHREALEETGWAVVVLGLLCVLRFRHRRPKPTGYSYPYPEFYQAIYCATAASFHPQAQQCGGYELGAEFQPVPAVRHLTLTPGEQVFLRAAVASEAFRQFQ